ncbi:DUF4180 domain-containing protein, partial [Streptomyces sp. NRRL B-24085]|uniref:DUF4180 domain-containing protein n=1 Tax=Streptomyces sp. NRRL B-24085 TaxID=1709476 RepID=UPI00277D08CD
MATDDLVHRGGVNVLHCAPDGPPLDGERAALDLIGDAMGRDAQVVAVPVDRVPEEFFRLRSGVAGAGAASGDVDGGACRSEYDRPETVEDAADLV